MRPLMLAACVVSLMLLSGSARAQVAPPRASDGGARTVMDVVLWSVPGDAGAACLQLPPGHMTLTLQVEAIGEPQPVRYRFSPYWYRAADSPPEIDVGVTRDPRTIEATLAGGRYCYSLTNEGAPPPEADLTGSPGPTQLIAVRMVLLPQ